MKIKQKVEDFEIYFSSNFGLENKTFEDLLRFQNTSTTEASDDQYIKHQITWPKLTFWNSYLYAEEQDNPFYLFQFSNEQKDLSFQLIVYVETSRVFGFKQGVIRQWSISPELLASGQLAKIIEAINDILQKNTPLISLRLQPYMPGIEVINKLKSIFLKLGLKKISAIAPEQTRFMDLRLSINDILKKFSTRTKATFFIKDSLVAKVEPIHDVLAIPGMQRALDDSFLRSIKQKCPYRFEPFLKLFNKNTNIISIYGLFFKDDSINPKAFVAGINHGPIFEYSIAGSASDAELRKFKFNNILLWKLIEEAKNNNCNFLDLGGISIESPENPTSGISKFKRHYPGFELTVGHEVLKILNPFKYQIFQTIKYLISLVRRT